MILLYIMIEFLFKTIGYSLAMYALWRLIGSPFLQSHIEAGIRQYKRKRQIKRMHQLNVIDHASKDKGPIFQHLELILSSISKAEKDPNVGNFIALTVIIFGISTASMYILLDDFLFSLLVGLALGFLPYINIRFNLANKRLKASYAFMLEYHLILQNYQSTGRDIYYTILNASKDVKDPGLKRVFMKLLSSLQKDGGANEFNKAIRVFVYAIDSSFSRRFGKLLTKAHIDSADISKSLMHLNEDIKKRKQDMEKDKTQKMETIALGYSPIVVLPLMVFMGYKYSGIMDFWFMFKQPIPIGIFTVCVLLSIASVLLAFLLSKPKADL